MASSDSLINLTLLHTNDLHGRVEQVVRIATLVKQIRTEVKSKGGACFYFDAGDAEDTILLESCLTRGSAMDVIMKGAGCDQITLGNAIPLRYGPQAIENLANHFGKPLLCANLTDSTGQIFKGLTPYVIETIGDYKIGIIGLTAPMSIYSIFFGSKPLQPVEIVPELIQRVRDAGAKTIIVLSHIGSAADINLSENVSGIDVIIGAHDHKRISPPLVVNDTLIVQSGEHGQMLGRLDLVLDAQSGKVISHDGELIPVGEEIRDDTDTLAVVAVEKERAQTLMRIEIGELLAPVECLEVQECSAGNLLADALLAHVVGAQVAFVINGHWNGGLEAGVVTQGELYAANRSAGNPARIELTGAQIKQFLVAALKPENIARKIHPLRGRAVGMPHIAGMRVKVDDRNSDLVEIYVNGARMKPDDRFIVAGSDMEFSEYLGYLVIPDEQINYEVPTILPEVVEEYIKQRSPLGRIPGNRIFKQ